MWRACPTNYSVLCTADGGLPGFAVDKGQLPLPSFLESTQATVLHLECLVDGSQLTDVFAGTTENRYLRDSAVVASARYHVAQTVEVAFEVVATLALHHIVLRAFVPLVIVDTTVRRRI